MSHDTHAVATEIMDLLRRELPNPRVAAACLAVVRANLHLQAGGTSEAKVRAMIQEDDAACFEIWTTITDARKLSQQLGGGVA